MRPSEAFSQNGCARVRPITWSGWRLRGGSILNVPVNSSSCPGQADTFALFGGRSWHIASKRKAAARRPYIGVPTISTLSANQIILVPVFSHFWILPLSVEVIV